MPGKQAHSRVAGKNISRLIHEGMPPKQAVAVGLSEARRAGGKVPPPKAAAKGAPKRSRD